MIPFRAILRSPILALPVLLLVLAVPARPQDDDDDDGDPGDLCRRNADCSDGDACNGEERCERILGRLRICVPGTPVSCPAAGGACAGTGVCDPSTGACLYPPAADGTPCDDDDACTSGDACRNGSCVATGGGTCPAPDQCHVAGACEPSTGRCTNVPRPDGSPCDDGNACTAGDTCRAGTCTAGAARSCPAPAPCRAAGICVPATGGCAFAPAPDGAPCDDGDACTTVDACRQGRCEGLAPVACPPADECRGAGTCDPATGTCTSAVRRDGSRCDDGDACTRDDACRAGVCAGGPAIACDDGVACTDDRCSAGRCVAEPRASRCLAAGCTRAECRPGRPDADERGCVATPVGEGEQCTDDDVACTDAVCRDGGCAQIPVDARCPAPDACGTGVCFPGFPGADTSGCTAGPPAPDGGACDEDGDPCTDDRCTRGVCQHPNVADRRTCEPVGGVYGRALAVVDGVAAVRAAVAADVRDGAGRPPDDVRVELDQRLAGMADAAGTVVAILSGRLPAAPTGITVADRRARAALPIARALSADARATLAAVRDGRRTGALTPEAGASLRGTVRGLRAQTRTLTRDLRALRRLTRLFAR